MDNVTYKSSSRLYRSYMAVMITLAVILLAALLAFLIYGALRIKQSSNDATKRVDGLTSQVQKINTNLENLNEQLQKLPAVPSSLQLNK